MATVHNEAKKQDIAKVVLTSGDPKRCEYIAKKYLTNIKLVNSVRGMTAYTGEYKGKKITIFPSGMGMPSMGIYAYELFKFYDVEFIIRIGTCGTLDNNASLLDTVLLDKSYTESNFAIAINRDHTTHISNASKYLNNKIAITAKNMKFSIKQGTGICSEVFDVYLTDAQFNDMLSSLPKEYNFIATEMEAFALFYIANMLNKQASCLLTVVDDRCNNTIITSEQREKKLDNMIILALETSLKL